LDITTAVPFLDSVLQIFGFILLDQNTLQSQFRNGSLILYDGSDPNVLFVKGIEIFLDPSVVQFPISQIPVCGNGVIEYGETCDVVSIGCQNCSIQNGYFCNSTLCEFNPDCQNSSNIVCLPKNNNVPIFVNSTSSVTATKGTASVNATKGTTTSPTKNLLDINSCFIATAAFGSADDENVWMLRKFRDETLLKYKVGQKFIEYYYDYSPPIADIIRENEIAKMIVRWILKCFIFIIG